MEIITIKDEFIKLGQALKLSGLADSGIEAKIMVQNGIVEVNGGIQTQRGKKLYNGDIFEFEGKQVKVTNGH